MHRENTTRQARISAQVLRNNMTVSEMILWEHLRKNKVGGVKFRRQYPKQTYILDFYAPKANIAIEVDGAIHESKRSMCHDNERSRNIEEWEIKVIRFSNDDIIEDVSTVTQKIEGKLHRKTNAPSP